MGYKTKIDKSVSRELQLEIISEYQKNGATIKHCAEKYGLHRWWITKILSNNNIPKKERVAPNKVEFTDQEKNQILDFYIKQKRGASYIAEQIGVSDVTIKKWLKLMNVPLWSRSELQSSNRKHYGPTKGFSGKKHKKLSKKRISDSLYKNCNRTVVGSKSQFIDTVIGKVQGSYEVAYLQKLLNENKILPKPGRKVITPLGLYFPDFEYDDCFLEIKSDFTWKVCKGEIPNPKGKLDDRQYRKILWTEKNVKPVQVIILDAKIAKELFLEGIANKNLVTENIHYKNGKYYKEITMDDRDGL
jgi:transposase-like protein